MRLCFSLNRKVTSSHLPLATEADGSKITPYTIITIINLKQKTKQNKTKKNQNQNHNLPTKIPPDDPWITDTCTTIDIWVKYDIHNPICMFI